MEDVLNAPISLLTEQKEKVTESFSTGIFPKSAVKSILIGDVPDRGGRAAGDTRSKANLKLDGEGKKASIGKGKHHQRGKEEGQQCVKGIEVTREEGVPMQIDVSGLTMEAMDSAKGAEEEESTTPNKKRGREA